MIPVGLNNNSIRSNQFACAFFSDFSANSQLKQVISQSNAARVAICSPVQSVQQAIGSTDSATTNTRLSFGLSLRQASEFLYFSLTCSNGLTCPLVRFSSLSDIYMKVCERLCVFFGAIVVPYVRSLSASLYGFRFRRRRCCRRRLKRTDPV